MTDSSRDKAPGTLTLVSTPIGNLGDMTYRGVEALKGASTVLAEDTRHTRKLFTHYGINVPLLPYHEHNEARMTPRVIERLRAGESFVLVSDAGTPGISDPGYRLVRAAVAEGIAVTVVPGANAVLPALLLSGFPTDAFVFEGFLPKKKGELSRRLGSLADERRTAVLFVSPYRLEAVLETLAGALPDRDVAVVREMTKIHEEVRRGTAMELLEHYRGSGVKGEIVLVVKGRGK